MTFTSIRIENKTKNKEKLRDAKHHRITCTTMLTHEFKDPLMNIPHMNIHHVAVTSLIKFGIYACHISARWNFLIRSV